jgi:hypothetical protein
MKSMSDLQAAERYVTRGEAPSVFNVTPRDIVASPYPHVISEQLVRPDLYRRLKDEFPPNGFFEKHQKTIGSRTGRDLFKGDPHFESFIKGSPAWSEFYEYIGSRAFLNYAMTLFGPHLRNFNCSVDPAHVKLVDYTENRFSLWWRSKKANYLGSRAGDPNKLFTRFDIEQSAEGYDKPIHCDWPSRLISVILYFSDADEIGMDGGDLRIHVPKDDRSYAQCARKPKPEEMQIVQTIRPRENLGLLFLCSNNSYHSVTAVRSIRDYRRFIYLNISSMAENIW